MLRVLEAGIDALGLTAGQEARVPHAMADEIPPIDAPGTPRGLGDGGR